MTAQPNDDGPFEKFLLWLSPDRDVALRKYDEIMWKIIKYFIRKSWPDPEDLAGETRDRVIRIINAGGNYPIHEALFYSVANKVWLEQRRKPILEPLPDPFPFPLPAPHLDKELEAHCLETCLAKLPDAERDLITHYYQDQGASKIEGRKRLAAEYGGENSLRVKVHRIRGKLRPCIVDCVRREMN